MSPGNRLERGRTEGPAPAGKVLGNRGSQDTDTGTIELHLLANGLQHCRSNTMVPEFRSGPHFGEVGDRNLLIPELNIAVDDSRMANDDGTVPDEEPVGGLV